MDMFSRSAKISINRTKENKPVIKKPIEKIENISLSLVEVLPLTDIKIEQLTKLCEGYRGEKL